ncbi:MAG TPA: cytochrome c-type biogenesis protein [Gammaproteobacteria bacterium]
MKHLLAALVVLFSAMSFAADVRFDDPRQQARYENLINELRCLVCQNQTIADSNADLALDLRNKVAEQIAAGKTDAEIIGYLTARYGDFVLYRPPVQANTLLLWTGPLLLLAAGLVVLTFTLRRRARLDDDTENPS